MKTLEQIKNTWLYAILITMVTSSAITYAVVESVITAPLKEENRRRKEDIQDANSEIQSLKKLLNRVKNDYDIPDFVISDYFNAEIKPEINFENLKVIKPTNFFNPISTVIERNQTTQIISRGLEINISVSDVNTNGQSKFIISYMLPDLEIPESLKYDLFPGEILTITTSDKVKLFYFGPISTNPIDKSVLVKIVALEHLRKTLKKQQSKKPLESIN